MKLRLLSYGRKGTTAVDKVTKLKCLMKRKIHKLSELTERIVRIPINEFESLMIYFLIYIVLTLMQIMLNGKLENQKH